MRTRHVLGVTLALAATAFAPAVSEAQDNVRLNLSTTLGVGGEVSVESDDLDDPDEGRGYDLVPTPSLQAGIEVPLHDFFTLGGEAGIAFWNSEERADPPSGVEEGDRQLQIDLLLRPKVRYAVLPQLEVYGVLPVGFTYYVPSDDRSSDELDLEANGGPGIAVGAGAGATYFVTGRFGLNAELGYLHRVNWASFDVGGDTVDITQKFGQFQLRAGMTLAF